MSFIFSFVGSGHTSFRTLHLTFWRPLSIGAWTSFSGINGDLRKVSGQFWGILLRSVEGYFADSFWCCRFGNRNDHKCQRYYHKLYVDV